MFHLLEVDIREQKKYKMRTQTSADNTVNDLQMKSSLEIVWKTKIILVLSETLLFFHEQEYILFLGT